MNQRPVTNRITHILLAIAVAVSALAFVNWGMERGVAAAVGASLSVLNWLVLRWLGVRILFGQGTERTLASLLVVGKIGLLTAIVFVLINRLGIDPIGLATGLGVLFVGPVLGGLLAGSNAPQDPSAPSAAHEER